MSNPETIRSRFFPVHPENDIYAPEEAVELAEKWTKSLKGCGVVRNQDGKIAKYHVVCIDRREQKNQIGFLVNQELRTVK
jgi:hypothetical protein